LDDLAALEGGLETPTVDMGDAVDIDEEVRHLPTFFRSGLGLEVRG